MTRTSSISGTFVNRQRSPVRVAAASIFSAAFFAPLIADGARAAARRPRRGRPPRVTGSGTYSQWNGRASAMRSIRACRGPSRWRRSATRMRSSACWSAARAAARSAPSSKPALERLLGLAAGLLGLLEVDLARPCRRSRPSRRPCPAGPGGTRRRSRRTPPAPPLRMRSSPTPSVETSGAWCGSTPSSPSLAGQDDAVDLVLSRRASRA